MVNEVSKIAQAQTTGAPTTKTAKKAEQKVQIFEGMTVKDVEKNGSEAQKIVAKAFDNTGVKPTKENNYNGGDGKYSKKEAENFNNYQFSLDKNKRELKAYNKKTGCTCTIKYNNLDELKENAALLKQAGHLKGGKIVFDFRNRTALYDGVSGGMLNVGSRGADKITIRNSDIRNISGAYFKGTLVLDNVKEMGMIWDSPTKVLLGEEATIKTDSNSKIEIRRYSHK
ncbi:hypothetical protein IJ541_05315 [bacterium]|nr:hypothetical protein [bacterium]